MPTNLKKRGQYWHYAFAINGVTHTGSTKMTDLASARLVFERVRRGIVLGEVGLRPAGTLKTVAEEWMEVKRSEVSPSHLASARYALAKLEPLHAVPLDKLNTHRVEAWRAGFLDGHSRETANLVLRYLKVWCNWALREAPFDLGQLSSQERVRPVLKADQFGTFLDAVDGGNVCGAQLRVAIRILLATGMRVSEVTHMRWEHLDWGAATYVVYKSKGKRKRTVTLPPKVLENLGQFPRSINGWVFPGEHGRPHGRSWLDYALQRGARAVGIKGHFGPHRLRATFATLHHANGIPLGDLQALMGHRHLSTTMMYVEPGLDRQRKAQEELAKQLGLA